MSTTHKIELPLEAAKRRARWLKEIVTISGNFGADSERLQGELEEEIGRDGCTAILQHLCLCGAIPEAFAHDSSEEKLYSKYTDILLALAFRFMGYKSAVIKERADSADVSCRSEKTSFVADAKAFRLSRTAKNQKDFKVEAMAGWKGDHREALVVAPEYQLPSNSSQIYEQAVARQVTILTYSHISFLLKISAERNSEIARVGLEAAFQAIRTLKPAKAAAPYWKAVNGSIHNAIPNAIPEWKAELELNLASLVVVKIEALSALDAERKRIESFSREEAIAELVSSNRFGTRQETISAVAEGGFLRY